MTELLHIRHDFELLETSSTKGKNTVAEFDPTPSLILERDVSDDE
jgi:hypothetical protein